MNADAKELLEHLLKIVTTKSQCGGCKCGCPEQNLLEQSAVRFNEQASFNAATLQQQAVSQQAAQFAALLKQQQSMISSTE